ncbi:MAG: nuclear transport factor 2 family protein [Steroidobacteraceae bacterium]|nr:nuclear transport factor 2 family protein [Steroidobacteraceae bacterium]
MTFGVYSNVGATMFLSLFAAVCQAGGADRSADEADLRELKEVLWPRAYFTQDARLLDRILAEEFESVDGEGNLSTKREELDWVSKNKPNYDSLTFSIRRLEIFGGDTAIVSGVGTIRGRREKGPYVGEYQSTNFFIKRGGVWRVVASHVSGYREK